MPEAHIFMVEHIVPVADPPEDLQQATDSQLWGTVQAAWGLGRLCEQSKALRDCNTQRCCRGGSPALLERASWWLAPPSRGSSCSWGDCRCMRPSCPAYQASPGIGTCASTHLRRLHNCNIISSVHPRQYFCEKVPMGSLVGIKNCNDLQAACRAHISVKLVLVSRGREQPSSSSEAVTCHKQLHAGSAGCMTYYTYLQGHSRAA